MAREILVYDHDLGKCVPKGERVVDKAFTYVPDEAPFISPIDFKTEISGRAARRELEKRHNMTQVGTDAPKARQREQYVPPDFVQSRWGD